jgi:flagellin
MERLSSGQRINSAADDSAGLAIRDKMTSQIEGLNQAVRNANDAISMAQSAEGGLAETTQILHRMRTLAMQASNDTNTASDRANLNAELTDLQAEITRIATTATFNNQNLLEGTMTDSIYQIGHKTGETVDLSIEDFSADSIGMGASQFDITAAGHTGDSITVSVAGTEVSYSVDGTLTGAALTAAAVATSLATALGNDSTFKALYTASADAGTVTITSKDNTVIRPTDVKAAVTQVGDSGTLVAGSVTETGTFLNATTVTTRANAQAAVKVIDYALDLVSKERANLGAFQNRLEHAVSNMMNMSANTADARSVIADADYAQESSVLAKNQILQQAGTAMLAQANAQAQTVLSLLK